MELEKDAVFCFKCERRFVKSHVLKSNCIIKILFGKKNIFEDSPVAKPQIFLEPCNTVRTKFFALSIPPRCAL